MLMTKTTCALIVCAAFATGLAARGLFSPAVTVHAAANRVFEIRTYTAAPGKLEALKSRFRDHTVKLFEKHGMKNIGYWTTDVGPRSNALTYMLAFKDANQRMEIGRAHV